MPSKEQQPIPHRSNRLIYITAALGIPTTLIAGYLYFSKDYGPVTVGSPTPPVPGQALPDPEPTPKSGYQEKADGITFRTKEGEVLSVPQINGLKAVVNEENGVKKVVYKASPDNTFGLEPGQNVGEYNPNVSMVIDGINKKTGGVVLTNVIGLKLLKEKLASISDSKDKWTFLIPLDIKDVNAPISLGLTTKRAGNLEFNFITVAIEGGSASLTNIIPESNQLRIGRPIFDNTYRQYAYPPSSLADSNTAAVNGMRTVTVAWKSTREKTTISSSFGAKIDQVEGVLLAHYSDITATTPEQLSLDKILSVESAGGNIPVFLAENSPVPTAQARPLVPSFSQSREQSRQAKETNIVDFRAAELARRKSA